MFLLKNDYNVIVHRTNALKEVKKAYSKLTTGSVIFAHVENKRLLTSKVEKLRKRFTFINVVVAF